MKVQGPLLRKLNFKFLGGSTPYQIKAGIKNWFSSGQGMATYGGVRFLHFFNSAIINTTKIVKIFTILVIFMMAKSSLFSGRIKKVKKADPPISGHSLPTTWPVLSFEHYLVWFGNNPKLKNGFSLWILDPYFSKLKS